MFDAAQQATETPASARYACPACAGKLKRVPRRMLDFMLGALIGVALRRYRCRNPACDWRGNLAKAGTASGADRTGPRYRGPLL